MNGFEFDDAKSRSNFEKHGIDFLQAQQLWDDPAALEVGVKSETEPRWLVIGRINEKHWSAVVTRRDWMIRIISVRRSRRLEIALYESQRI